MMSKSLHRNYSTNGEHPRSRFLSATLKVSPLLLTVVLLALLLLAPLLLTVVWQTPLKQRRHRQQL